jgi:hypothetical protein
MTIMIVIVNDEASLLHTVQYCKWTVKYEENLNPA